MIDLLLDFVEAMNEGVVFTRCYTVLKDRDITGELKEVWMAVQVKRDKEQESQQETWIDVRPPAPQYPQFEISPDYSYQPSNEQQVYQSNPGHMVAAQQYHGGIGQEQYSYGERGRSQNQANCPAYPTAQYQFQQLPRQLVPQYINSNIHPGVAPNYGNPGVQVAANVNPNIPGHYQQYIALQQQMVGQRQLENVMHAARENHVTDMQQQQQHIQHIQSVPQYEQPPPFGMQPGSQINVLRLGRPHMGVTQKSNANKRGQTTNSPTHVKSSSVNGGTGNRQYVKDTGVGDKSDNVKGFRMKVLRDQGKVSTEIEEEAGRSNVQVTDLDEESDEMKQSRDKDSQIIDTRVLQKCTSRQGAGAGRRKELRQQILNSSEEITVLETDLPLEGTEDNAPSQNFGNKPVKTQILVLKRNSAKSSNGDSKIGGKESKEQQKTAKNAIRLTKLEGQQIYDLECSERVGAGAKEEDHAQHHDSGDKKIGDLSNGSGVRNGYAQYKNQKDNRPKRSQTVNNIIKNVFKIHPSTSSEDKDRVNNQVKCLNGKLGDNNDEEVYHGYAILRKGDPNQDDVVNEIAKISIQDCKESNENGNLGS